MINWEDIRRDWETSDKTLKQLAQDHDVKVSTIRSRKSREQWFRGDATSQNVATSSKGHNKRPKPKAQDYEEEFKVTYEKMNPDLNERQKLFCMYYIKYFNATKAYRKAYPGVTYNTAMINGSKALRNTKIKAEVERLKKEKYGRIGLDANVILQKWVDIAFADISDFMEFGTEEVEIEDRDTGVVETVRKNFVRFQGHQEVDGTIVSEVKQGRDGVALKLQDKIKALDMLTRYVDLLSERDKQLLQEEKLKVEIERIKAEANAEGDGGDQPIIVTNEEAMRRIMNERASGKSNTD